MFVEYSYTHQKTKRAPSLIPAKLFDNLTFYPLIVAKYSVFDYLNILLFYMSQTKFSKQGEYKSNKMHHIYRITPYNMSIIN